MKLVNRFPISITQVMCVNKSDIFIEDISFLVVAGDTIIFN